MAASWHSRKRSAHEDAAQRLAETLEEEKAADEKLNEIAEGSVNQKALGAEAGEIGDDDTDDEDEAPQRAPGRASKEETGGSSRRAASGASRSQSRRT
jgi:Domain of unknown function (DUF892)